MIEQNRRQVLEFGTDIDDDTGLPMGAGFDSDPPPAYPMTTTEPSQVDKETQTEVDAFLDEMGAEEQKAKVVIYKLSDDSGAMGYCKRMPVSTFKRAGGSEWAVSKWGPGEYQFRIFVEGHKGIYRKWDMVLIGDPEAFQKAAPVASQSNDLLQGLSALASAMQQGFTSMMQVMEKNRPQERTTRDLLEEMALFKNILGGDSGGPSALMDVFLKGMEIARENNSDKESNTNDLLINLAHELMPLLDKAIAADRPKTPQLPAPEQTRRDIVKQAETSQRQPQTEAEKMQMFLRAILSKQVKAAKKGGDVLVYSNVLLDDVPEQYYENLYEFLNQSNWFEKICEMSPDAKGFADWFERLRGEVLLLLTEGDSEDENDNLTPDTEPGKNPAGELQPGGTEKMKGEPNASS